MTQTFSWAPASVDKRACRHRPKHEQWKTQPDELVYVCRMTTQHLEATRNFLTKGLNSGNYRAIDELNDLRMLSSMSHVHGEMAQASFDYDDNDDPDFDGDGPVVAHAKHSLEIITNEIRDRNIRQRRLLSKPNEFCLKPTEYPGDGPTGICGARRIEGTEYCYGNVYSNSTRKHKFVAGVTCPRCKGTGHVASKH